MALEDLPTFIPLEEAARRYGLSREALTRLVENDRIEAVTTMQGDILVSDYSAQQAKTKEQIIREEFNHLRGNPITITEAAEKYELHRDTVLEWVKQEYIKVIKPGYRMEIDEADVAYCARVHHRRKAAGITGGVPLLDENGLPYKLKHPDLSKYRRRKRREKR